MIQETFHETIDRQQREIAMMATSLHETRMALASSHRLIAHMEHLLASSNAIHVQKPCGAHVVIPVEGK